MLIVRRPRRHDHHERQRRARQPDPQHQVNVALEVAEQKGEDLECILRQLGFAPPWSWGTREENASNCLCAREVKGTALAGDEERKKVGEPYACETEEDGTEELGHALALEILGSER